MLNWSLISKPIKIYIDYNNKINNRILSLRLKMLRFCQRTD
nr:hypothetical protein CJLB15_00081 [Campylobacter phage CJLB-15]